MKVILMGLNVGTFVLHGPQMQAYYFTWSSTKETVIYSNTVENTGCVGLRDSILVSNMAYKCGHKESSTCANMITEREKFIKLWQHVLR
jgi:hypothetical protein